MEFAALEPEIYKKSIYPKKVALKRFEGMKPESKKKFTSPKKVTFKRELRMECEDCGKVFRTNMALAQHQKKKCKVVKDEPLAPDEGYGSSDNTRRTSFSSTQDHPNTSSREHSSPVLSSSEKDCSQSSQSPCYSPASIRIHLSKTGGKKYQVDFISEKAKQRELQSKKTKERSRELDYREEKIKERELKCNKEKMKDREINCNKEKVKDRELNCNREKVKDREIKCNKEKMEKRQTILTTSLPVEKSTVCCSILQQLASKYKYKNIVFTKTKPTWAR